MCKWIRKMRNRKAFTIVELVIVIAVIAILATVLVPTFGNVINNAKDSAAKQEAKNAYTEYVVEAAASGSIGQYFVYEADAGRFVAIDSGSVVGVYESKEAALAAMVGTVDTTKIFDTANDKLFVYGSKPVHGTGGGNDDGGNDGDSEPDEPSDSFAGKKVSILGDSISTFGGVPNVLNNVYPNSSVKAQSDTWWQQVIDAMGMELLVNNASGGSRILSDEYFNGTGIRNGNYAAYRDRCVNLHSGEEKPDVILVFMGTNDFSYHVTEGCTKCQAMLNCQECTRRTDKNVNVCASCRTASGVNSSFCNQPLGTADSVDPSNTENPTSTCEAYAIMLNKMKTAYPDAKIYCLSLLPRVNPYQGGYHDHGQPTAFNAELKKVAENAGATFINLENCVDNASTTWSTYFGDAVHPTATGMDFISQAVIDAMLGRDAAHAITWNLTGVTSNVTNNLIMDGSSLSVTLTANSGYKVSSVKVTMGGVDITDSVYADGTITIPEVTGNVTVTATAEVDLESSVTWTVGAINSNNGTDSYMDSRVVTGYIPVIDDIVISVTGGNAEFCVFYYDSAKNYITPYDGYTNSNIYVNPSKCAYIRIMARNKGATEATLTVDYGSNISVAASIWTVGAVHTGDGSIVGASQYPHRIYSDLIDVSEGATVSVLGGGAAFCPIFYNADGTFASSPNNYTTETLTILPGQYSYMRLMVCDYNNRSDASKTLTASYGENIAVTFGTPNIVWSSGTINTENGANTALDNRIRSGFFDIRNGGLTVSTANNAEVNIVYYDKDMKILANQYSGWTTSWNSASATNGVVYVRVVARSNPQEGITSDYGQNITVTFPCAD